MCADMNDVNKKDKREHQGMNRRLTRIEAFAYALPVLALALPLVLAIVLPKTPWTRAIFGGWNSVLIIIAILSGAVWWSRRLLGGESNRSLDSDDGNGA